MQDKVGETDEISCFLYCG